MLSVFFYSSTYVGVCLTAGIIFSVSSSLFNAKLDVFMHGWHPISGSLSKSRSIIRRTLHSVSNKSPKTLAEPGVQLRYFSIYSGGAKESLEQPSCGDKSFVLNGFSPGIMSK